METTTRVPNASHGSSVARNGSRPGSGGHGVQGGPDGVSTTSGRWSPARGLRVIDRVTKPPRTASPSSGRYGAARGRCRRSRRPPAPGRPGHPRARPAPVRSRSRELTQRTRSPRTTGPSVQARTSRATPSSPTTGSGQPRHRPVLHGWGTATAVWLQARAARPPQRRRGAMSTRPAAYTTSRAGADQRVGEGTSAARPRIPTEPSSVTTLTARADRRASRADSRCASSRRRPRA